LNSNNGFLSTHYNNTNQIIQPKTPTSFYYQQNYLKPSFTPTHQTPVHQTPVHQTPVHQIPRPQSPAHQTPTHQQRFQNHQNHFSNYSQHKNITLLEPSSPKTVEKIYSKMPTSLQTHLIHSGLSSPNKTNNYLLKDNQNINNNVNAHVLSTNNRNNQSVKINNTNANNQIIYDLNYYKRRNSVLINKYEKNFSLLFDALNNVSVKANTKISGLENGGVEKKHLSPTLDHKKYSVKIASDYDNLTNAKTPANTPSKSKINKRESTIIYYDTTKNSYTINNNNVYSNLKKFNSIKAKDKDSVYAVFEGSKDTITERIQDLKRKTTLKYAKSFNANAIATMPSNLHANSKTDNFTTNNNQTCKYGIYIFF
jgi:hypothetical protein